MGLIHKLSLHENAPRAPDKLERLLQVKQRQKEEAMHIEDIQRLVTEEIEMLKVLLHLVRSEKEAAKFVGQLLESSSK